MSSLASRIVLDTAHPERYAAYLGHLCRSLYVRVSLEKTRIKSYATISSRESVISLEESTKSACWSFKSGIAIRHSIGWPRNEVYQCAS